MWRLVARVLQAALLTTAAATAIVVIGVATSSLWPTPTLGDPVDPAEATLEVRLTSPHPTPHVFVGQPLVIDVTLTNLEARRARNQAPIDPTPDAQSLDIQLDDPESGMPWTRRLTMTMSTPGGASVLNRLDWLGRLLESPTADRLALTPARATFILDSTDIKDLLPGAYLVRATVPPSLAPASRVAVIPLEFDLGPQPTTDANRALVSLAQARAAALQGEPTAAIEAALTALALDPLQDEALVLIAEGWEEQGSVERAIQWYERYLETLGTSQSERRRSLESYVEALRRQ